MEIEMQNLYCNKYKVGDLLVNNEDKNKIIQIIKSDKIDEKYWYYELKKTNYESLLNGVPISYKIGPVRMRPCGEIYSNYTFIVNQPLIQLEDELPNPTFPVPAAGGICKTRKYKKARKTKRKKNKKSRKSKPKKN